MKGFALGLALKQRRKATRKSPVRLQRAKAVTVQEQFEISDERNCKKLFKDSLVN